MAQLTMPKINISFSTAAGSFIARGERGVVLQVLRNAALGGQSFSLSGSGEAPAGLSAENVAQIENCFLGYITPPRKMLIYVIDEGENTLQNALDWAATQQFDYICGPADVSAAEAAKIASWVKQQRANSNAIYKAVLPECAADSEAVVNFAGGGIRTTAGTYGAAAYCSRIAGLLAGTPMTISATYAPLPEAADVERMTKDEMDAAVGAGKFLLWYDGTQVRTGRAVNSLVTTTQSRGDPFKKIKIVTAVDQIDSDIRNTIRRDYIGKYANSYDNKLVLVTAIRGYLQGLQDDGILNAGWSFDIDTDAQRTWLKAHGYATDVMDDREVREANTGSEVFLYGNLPLLDAIEDVTIKVTI